MQRPSLRGRARTIPESPEDPLVEAYDERPDGFNVLMGDGSVRTVSGIDPQSWWGMTTIAGGEIIDE
ncbi:MAG: hypothetical protein R3C03_07295 [Pirellulaceae bacterium]